MEILLLLRSGVFGADLVLRFCLVNELRCAGLRKEFGEREIPCVFLWYKWYGWVCTVVYWPGGTQGGICVGG